MLPTLYSGTVFAIESGMVDIRPYVSASTMYDDNLFRFATKQQALASGISRMDDTMATVSAGVNVGVRLSRQRLLLGLGLSDTKFDSNKSLDYTANNSTALWNWQLGNHLDGVLSYTESESAPGFQERLSVAKNLRTSTKKLGSINWHFHPSWLMFASYDLTTSDNSNPISRTLNSESDTVEAGIQFESVASTRVRVSLRNNETRYLNRTGLSLLQFGDKSNQQQLITNVAWSPSRLTKLNATFALVDLEYPSNNNRNFSGTSQSLGMDYALTSNTNVSFSVFKDVSAIQDVVSNYVETTGFTVRPTWQATSKISVGGSVEYRDRTFIGSAGVYSNATAERQDQTKSVNTFLSYQVTRKMSLFTNYSNENRSSNVNDFVTKANTLSATLRYDF
jgi:exopolysaccharide biosynthesis operon protein EpsL